MEDRRTFLGLAAAAALLPIGLDAQAAAQSPAGRAPASPPGDLARHALTGPFEGYEAVVVDRTAAPPTPGAPPRAGHRHSGFVLGYVIEGQLRFAINNEPERIVPAGGTFFEPIGALHSTNAAVPGAPARFVAFLVVPKGAPVVTPA
jgi:quercetin dioxygenase-like cupin family protein